MRMIEEKAPRLRGVSSALVVGLGISGRAAADRLLREGIKVTVNDVSEADVVREAATELSERGAQSALGHHDAYLLEEKDLLVVSPGVPPGLPLLREAMERGIPVWSEVELAWRLACGPVVAVTGTNGKTTTVSMIEWVCNRSGRAAVAAGNIGYPFVKAVEEAAEGTLLVVEASSFQLTYTVDFRPDVAVLLNIGEDHFDWHEDMEEYVAAKSRIWANQGPGDVVICNMDDPLCARAVASAPSRVAFFSRTPREGAEVFVDEGGIFWRDPRDGTREVMQAIDLPLPGWHNLENAMAALGVAVSLGIEPAAAGEALADFRGLPHRLQFVGEAGGMRFYDDSKATNPHAALHALAAFRGPLVVILGGRNKGLDFRELAAELGRRGGRGEIRVVYLLGEAAEEIAGELEGEHVRLDVRSLPGLEEVFADLQRTARDGDVVLFTPACASFDRYSDYKERGRHFQSLVKSYGGRGESNG